MSPCLCPRVQNQANVTISSNCTNEKGLSWKLAGGSRGGTGNPSGGVERSKSVCLFWWERGDQVPKISEREELILPLVCWPFFYPGK